MKKNKIILRIVIIMILLSTLTVFLFFINWNIDINPLFIKQKTNKLVKEYVPEDFEAIHDSRIKMECSTIKKGIYNCKKIERNIEWKDWKGISYNISLLIENNKNIEINVSKGPKIVQITIWENIEDVDSTYYLTKEIIKDYLVKSWKPVSDDLDSITDLTIWLKKNHIKYLDISGLSSLKNLKKLHLRGSYDAIEVEPWVLGYNADRDWYLDIQWFEYLTQIEELNIHDFPLYTLDWKKFPPNLKKIDFRAIWLKNLENECELLKIKKRHIEFERATSFFDRYENCKNK